MIPAAEKKISVGACLMPLRDTPYERSIFLSLCGFIKVEQAVRLLFCYAVFGSAGYSTATVSD